tara:strand:- start:157 stop:459 length:303 start_codon:yes stop_codon:yes gene_type:complete
MASKLKQIWRERKKIFEGIKNSLIYDKFIEKVAKQRNYICDSCAFKGNKCAVPKSGPCCNVCGCSLQFKTRALSTECPKGKWGSVLSEEQEDKLDQKFNY